MAVVIGKIHAFRPGRDDWTLYVKHLGHLFVVNDIKMAEKKWATILSAIGDNTYKLLSSLLSPVKPERKTSMN